MSKRVTNAHDAHDASDGDIVSDGSDDSDAQPVRRPPKSAASAAAAAGGAARASSPLRTPRDADDPTDPTTPRRPLMPLIRQLSADAKAARAAAGLSADDEGVDRDADDAAFVKQLLEQGNAFAVRQAHKLFAPPHPPPRRSKRADAKAAKPNAKEPEGEGEDDDDEDAGFVLVNSGQRATNALAATSTAQQQTKAGVVAAHAAADSGESDDEDDDADARADAAPTVAPKASKKAAAASAAAAGPSDPIARAAAARAAGRAYAAAEAAAAAARRGSAAARDDDDGVDDDDSDGSRAEQRARQHGRTAGAGGGSGVSRGPSSAEYALRKHSGAAAYVQDRAAVARKAADFRIVRADARARNSLMTNVHLRGRVAARLSQGMAYADDPMGTAARDVDRAAARAAQHATDHPKSKSAQSERARLQAIAKLAGDAQRQRAQQHEQNQKQQQHEQQQKQQPQQRRRGLAADPKPPSEWERENDAILAAARADPKVRSAPTPGAAFQVATQIAQRERQRRDADARKHKPKNPKGTRRVHHHARRGAGRADDDDDDDDADDVGAAADHTARSDRKAAAAAAAADSSHDDDEGEEEDEGPATVSAPARRPRSVRGTALDPRWATPPPDVSQQPVTVRYRQFHHDAEFTSRYRATPHHLYTRRVRRKQRRDMLSKGRLLGASDMPAHDKWH